MDVIIVVLKSQSTSFEVIKARKSRVHLLYEGHREKSLFGQGQEVDLFAVSFNLRSCFLCLIQVKFEHLEDGGVVFLPVEKVNFINFLCCPAVKKKLRDRVVLLIGGLLSIFLIIVLLLLFLFSFLLALLFVLLFPLVELQLLEGLRLLKMF